MEQRNTILNDGERYPMLSPPCESVQICTDPDRYPRICWELISRKYSFEIEISW